jgi:hypothetical protein
MSDVERDILVRYGRDFNVNVKNARVTSDDQTNPQRDRILGEVNDCLAQWQSPVRVRTGQLPYEVFVQCRGVRKGDYLSLAGDMASSSFAGQNPARDLLQWSQGSLPLARLDNHSATMAVIIYFAEVGRGFSNEVGQFEAWLREKVQLQSSRQAFQSWRDFPSRFTFALKALQDGAYTP